MRSLTEALFDFNKSSNLGLRLNEGLFGGSSHKAPQLEVNSFYELGPGGIVYIVSIEKMDEIKEYTYSCDSPDEDEDCNELMGLFLYAPGADEEKDDAEYICIDLNDYYLDEAYDIYNKYYLTTLRTNAEYFIKNKHM